MRKLYQRFAAGILAAAMIAPAAAGMAEPLCVSAYELLGETSFTHKLVPWHTVQYSPARQEVHLEDGAAHIVILVAAGAEHACYDLQFRHRGLDFKQGHEYRVRFKAKACRDGIGLTSFIGDPKTFDRYFVLDGESKDLHAGPHMGGQWSNPAVLTTEYQEFSGIFKPTKDLSGAEWTFQYASDENSIKLSPIDSDELWFDDLSVEDLTDQETVLPEKSYGYTGRGLSGLEQNYISVNQLGYYPYLEKIAVLGDNRGDSYYAAESIELTGSYDFELVSAEDGSVVYTGRTGTPKADTDSGDTVCKIDFTGFTQEGEYFLRIKEQGWQSAPFRIDKDLYSADGCNLLTDSLNTFYQNRAGTDIQPKYITSGDQSALAHAASQDEAIGLVQSQWPQYPLTVVKDAEKNQSSRLDVRGGWYTGSDNSKNMTAGGLALWTLQNLYERAARSEKGRLKFADGSGTVVVPETDNQIPDLLDECKYELDFMAKLKVQPDEKTWGDFAGLYYHGMQGIGFRPVQPDYDHEYHAAFAVMPPTFAATLHYAACAAQGARLFAPYDEAYAAELLTAAKEAYAAYKQHFYYADRSSAVYDGFYPCIKEELNPQSLYAPGFQQTGTVSDGDAEIADEAYWAACELYLTAKQMQDADADTYLADLSDFPKAFRIGCRTTSGEDASMNVPGEYTFTVFSRTNPAFAGSLSLLLHRELLSDEQSKLLRNSLLDTAENYLYEEKTQGYGVPYKYDGPGYVDTFNMFPSDTIVRGYEYGSNEHAVINLIALAYAYDETRQQKYLNGVTAGMNYLLGTNPMAFSFITGYGSYHAENPAHRFWQKELDSTLPAAPDGVLVSGPNVALNDAYVRLLGFVPGRNENISQRCYADSVESWSTNAASLTANAALAWVVSYLQDEAGTAIPYVMGDVSGDGVFTVADVVLFQRWLLADPNAALSNWSKADFSHDFALNSADLALMKRELRAVPAAVPGMFADR